MVGGPLPSFAFTRSSPAAGAPLASTSAGIADAINVLADYKALAESANGQDPALYDAILAAAYSKTADSSKDVEDDIALEIANTRRAQPGAFSHHVLGVLV